MSYVLVSEYNDYDQHGSYFVAWFRKKPTVKELANALKEEECTFHDADNYVSLAKWILKVGGRKDNEYTWYTLKSVKSAN